MAYGLGHVKRRPLIDEHLRRGGRLIGWDLPYWQRDKKGAPDHPMRLTIDADHPWRLIKPEPPERWDTLGIELREDADQSGPILIASLGRKAAALAPRWEGNIRQAVKSLYPGVPIVHRQKTKHQPGIEDALKGKRLAVVKHSNVAVDACIAGVPVMCEDGAAYALYKDNVNPSREQRLQFLRSLAWWQWKPSEARQAWNYIKQTLSA